MKLINFSNRQRLEANFQQVMHASKPVLLYLGCLHHIQDIGSDQPGFFDYMHQIFGKTNAETIMPVDTNTSFDNLTKTRDDFNQGTHIPSGLAEFVYNNTFAPIVDKCPDIFEPNPRKKLQNSLENISIFGYSYGTSLLQQVGVVMADHLRAKFPADKTRGARIFDVCKSVKAITVGPVSRPYQINDDGATSVLRFDDPNFAQAKTIFTHASFLMREDKIAQRAYGNESFGGKLTSETGIEVRETRSMKLVIDYTQNPTRMAFGFKHSAEDEIKPEVIKSFDAMVHHPRLYTNTDERLGNLRVFPSNAISTLVRKAASDMLQPCANADIWFSNISEQIETSNKRSSLVQSFQALRAEFEDIVATTQSLPEQSSALFLKQLVEKIQ